MTCISLLPLLNSRADMLGLLLQFSRLNAFFREDKRQREGGGDAAAAHGGGGGH